MNIKEIFNSVIEIWKIATKPNYEDTKRTFRTVMILSLFVGFLAFIIFVLVHSIILFSSFFSRLFLYVVLVSAILTAIFLIVIFKLK